MNKTENLPTLTDDYCIKEFGWTKSRFEVIQRTYFKGLTVDDIAIFGHVCKHVGLDPFLKQIYPVVRDVKQKDGSKKPTMSIQTGIDGYRAIAERTGRYSPGKEPLFKYEDKRLFSATAYVMKMTADGKWHEVAATAIMSEYRPAFQNDFWATKPHIMLSKCAEALALRKAFPAELSGVYTKEEMDQADKEEIQTVDFEDVTNEDESLENSIQNKIETIEPEKIEIKNISNSEYAVLDGFLKQLSAQERADYETKLTSHFKIQSLKDLPKINFNQCFISLEARVKIANEKKASNENN